MLEIALASSMNPNPEQFTMQRSLRGGIALAAPLLIESGMKGIIDIMAAIQTMKIVMVLGVIHHCSPA